MTITSNLLHPPPVAGNLHYSMNFTYEHVSDFQTLIQPETPLESLLLDLPEFHVGYNWGMPRFGHPEGKVGLHVREVLDNVDNLDIDFITRRQLRLITLAHDTFKYKESKFLPRIPANHHGTIARVFMERYLDNEDMLDVIELHDEAYYVWRHVELDNKPELANRRLENLLNRLGDNLPLYFLFFKCDTQTGDKIQAPLRWFERVVKEAKF